MVWRLMLPGKVMPCFPVFEDNHGAVQPEYGDKQADAGRDCRTRLARPNSQARTGRGKY